MAITLLMQALGIALTAWMVSSWSSERQPRSAHAADPEPTVPEVATAECEDAGRDRQAAGRAWGWIND